MPESTATAAKPPQVVSVPTPIKPGELTREQIDLIKRTVAKGASDDELALFLYQCKRTGLDPLNRQIYFVKRWDSDEGREVGAVQTGIDGLRPIAHRAGRYRPDDETPTFAYDEKGDLVSAAVKVFTFFPETKEWYKVPAIARMSEYAQTKKDGTPFRSWKKMPHIMLAKCAEALAIRKAFPNELSGIYAFEEFGEPEPGTGSAGASAAKEETGNGETAAEPPAKPATVEQRQMMHQLWKSKHKLSELSFKRWLNHNFQTLETKSLSFDQARMIVKTLQEKPTDLFADELRGIPELPEEKAAQEGAQAAGGPEQTKL